MTQYSITLKETIFYTVEVDAEDEDDAREAAVDIWTQSADPMNDFCGAGNGVDVYRVEKRR